MHGGVGKSAILLDGAFVIAKLREKSRRFPSAEEIEGVCRRIEQHDAFRALRFLRIYFYHAPPVVAEVMHPLDKQALKLGQSKTARQSKSLLDKLEVESHFALPLSLPQLVETVVVVSGDSDPVPAFKFARREGLRLFLDHLGHGVRREPKAHADLIL